MTSPHPSPLRFRRLLLTGAAGGLGRVLRPRLRGRCDFLRVSDVAALDLDPRYVGWNVATTVNSGGTWTVTIPPSVEGKGSPGLRKLTKGSDNYLGIFATLALLLADARGAAVSPVAATPAGAEAVPPNLARVSTQFAAPVAITAEATLELAAEDGSRVILREPEPCPGWVPGLCVRWRPGSPVLSDMAYRPGGGSLRDLAGRAAVAPAATEWFVTASAADLEAPGLGSLAAMRRGPCVYVELAAAEPLQLRMTIGDGVDEAVAGPGPVLLGLRVGPAEVMVAVRAEDLAGNASERALMVAAGPESEAPPLGMSEILANPRGPEPTQEFVELVDLRADGAAQAWTGLFLADRGAAAITGEEGDALPAFATRPGERVLVVAAGYDPHEGSDVGPVAGTQLVRVDGSLAAGGPARYIARHVHAPALPAGSRRRDGALFQAPPRARRPGAADRGRQEPGHRRARPHRQGARAGAGACQRARRTKP